MIPVASSVAAAALRRCRATRPSCRSTVIAFLRHGVCRRRGTREHMYKIQRNTPSAVRLPRGWICTIGSTEEAEQVLCEMQDLDADP